jgi:enterochelin esterase-like enzyme
VYQKQIALLLFCATALVTRVRAEENKPETPPPAKRQRIVSPEILAENRVTFRLRAPDAKKVSLFGEWDGKTVSMTKEDNGVWSVTVGPLTPALYGYGMVVDGLKIIDPSNSNVKPQRSPNTSILEIPSTPSRLDEFQDVPHGTVRLHTYRSKALNVLRHLQVYTPPGYDSTRENYPTLYLLHGSGDNQAGWTSIGRAHYILDNLIAQTKAKPMVIVMTDGHAAFPPAQTPIAELLDQNTTAFESDLFTDVMPFIESNYRVVKDREGRAICGLSMGGGQALTIGCNHLELFAWVGGFSAAIFHPEKTGGPALSDSAATNGKLKLLWIACGKSDGLAKHAEKFSELLKEKGIRHELKITEGNHSWPIWRLYLADFLPLIFVEKN